MKEAKSNNIKDIDELYSLLKNEKDLLEKLKKVEEKKNKKLMAGKLFSIEEITEELSVYANELKLLENKRLPFMIRLARRVGLDPQSVSLSDIVKAFDEKDKERFNTIKDNLTNLTEEVKRLNHLNGELIKDQLSLIDCTISVCMGEGGLETDYSQGKEETKNVGSLMLDKKI